LNASSVIFKPAFNKGGVGELNPHPNVTMVDTTEAGVMRNVVARGGEVGTWGPCGCHLVRGKDPMRQPKIQADSSHPQKHSHHFVPSHE
jgi:hypothetical protein